MTNWVVRRLGDISDSCLGKMLDKEKNKGEYQPYLANLNVQWGEFKLGSLQRMRFEGHEQKRYGLKYGDLVICEGGEPGRCAIWRNELTDIKIQKALHRLRLHSGYCSDFLYYRMLLAGKNRELSRHFIGSTIKHLTGGRLKDVEFEFPCLGEQVNIAKALRLLDEKIETNNKINTKLEAMAKLIYDYWFVQFDFPDANGKPYKSSGGKMVYNEGLKREIPEGWGAKKIKDIASTGSGGTPLKSKSEYYDSGNIPWINSGEVNKPFIIEAKKFITELGVEKSSAKPFPSGTILMAMYGATAGKVSFIDFSATTNQAVCAINPSNPNFNYYLKFGLEDLYKYLVNLSSGSARDNLSQDKIKELNFSIPPCELLEKYNTTVKFGMTEILTNMKENSKLAELRDWLLPMLMNGQVTVKDVQANI